MTEIETRNLGELFRERMKGQWYTRPANAKGKARREESGISGIRKMYRKDYAQGYCFEYIYIKKGKRTKYLYRKNLIDLYELIVNQLHDEIIVSDKKKARKFIEKYTNSDEEYKILFNKIRGVKC
jgi:hypothetical protein